MGSGHEISSEKLQERQHKHRGRNGLYLGNHIIDNRSLYHGPSQDQPDCFWSTNGLGDLLIRALGPQPEGLRFTPFVLGH